MPGAGKPTIRDTRVQARNPTKEASIHQLLRRRCSCFSTSRAVLAALELLVGIRLILSPLSVSRLVLTVAGIALVACGVWELIDQKRVRKYIAGDHHIIDAD